MKGWTGSQEDKEAHPTQHPLRLLSVSTWTCFPVFFVAVSLQQEDFLPSVTEIWDWCRITHMEAGCIHFIWEMLRHNLWPAAMLVSQHLNHAAFHISCNMVALRKEEGESIEDPIPAFFALLFHMCSARKASWGEGCPTHTTHLLERLQSLPYPLSTFSEKLGKYITDWLQEIQCCLQMPGLPFT